jgi:hypothetical protein
MVAGRRIFAADTEAPGDEVNIYHFHLSLVVDHLPRREPQGCDEADKRKMNRDR